MFVFFFGCVSTITPPVALASYVAAGIAGADINKVGWTAFSYGITCYVLPFMFFFGPALMLNGSFFDISLAAISGFVGTFFIAASVIGFINQALPPALRALSFAAGLLLLLQGWQTDIVGVVLALGLMLFSRVVSHAR
jgi:TRAP-type uncharacterized transport system fused permease subunit